MLLHEQTTKLKEHTIEPLEDPKESYSYYSWIEVGKVLPIHLATVLFFELKKEKDRTHKWKQIIESTGVDDVGRMEEEMKNMRVDIVLLKFNEDIRKYFLEKENKKLRA